ncbi:hypothetical protein J5N97_016062 [Dioscorea zingiberensis]|uniref:Uncharacterized protein n=1 Tax=Dioscorea zingiberensis TaxID=325984 RepID=A0A9D5CK82_9LILI|nr:hypothetical protein J5N97_016062 [Dioscorea zingiberensis]
MCLDPADRWCCKPTVKKGAVVGDSGEEVADLRPWKPKNGEGEKEQEQGMNLDDNGQDSTRYDAHKNRQNKESELVDDNPYAWVKAGYRNGRGRGRGRGGGQTHEQRRGEKPVLTETGSRSQSMVGQASRGGRGGANLGMMPLSRVPRVDYQNEGQQPVSPNSNRQLSFRLEMADSRLPPLPEQY